MEHRHSLLPGMAQDGWDAPEPDELCGICGAATPPAGAGSACAHVPERETPGRDRAFQQIVFHVEHHRRSGMTTWRACWLSAPRTSAEELASRSCRTTNSSQTPSKP